MVRKDLDKIIIVATLLLMGIGVLMVYSASYIVAAERYGDGYFFLKKQLLYIVLGLLALVGGMHFPYNRYRVMVYPMLILSVLLLLVPLLSSLGVEAGGARRWIRIGHITFQPSELAKLSLIIYLAYFFSSKAEKVKTFGVGFLPPLIIGSILIALVIREPDFGGAMFLATLLLFMMFVAGVRMRYILSLFLVTMPFLYLMVVRVGYRWNRIIAFLDPWKESGGAGFQIVQSFVAFGSGGLWGKGPGNGGQKLFYLPEAHTDFILSVIGEELGLIGVAVILFLYILILYGGVRIAFEAPDLFGTYLAIGVVALITLQAIINMGVVTGLLPPKGLPLPFVSYGGSSFIVNSVSMGILLNIYYRSREL